MVSGGDNKGQSDGQAAGRAVRIVVADADARVRSALRLLLEQELSAVVAGEAGSARAALAAVAAQQPDLLLLDWDLVVTGACTGGVMARLRVCCPALSIVALSGQPEAGAGALLAGADEFVIKGEPPERLLGALRSVVPRRRETGRTRQE